MHPFAPPFYSVIDLKTIRSLLHPEDRYIQDSSFPVRPGYELTQDAERLYGNSQRKHGGLDAEWQDKSCVRHLPDEE